jgi:hypothetical protein
MGDSGACLLTRFSCWCVAAAALVAWMTAETNTSLPTRVSTLIGISDAGRICNRRLRTGSAAKLKPECSHLRGLTEGGSSRPVIAYKITRAVESSFS